MNKLSALVIFTIFLVVLSGCSEIKPVAKVPTAQDIISNPEKYEAQEIEIMAYTYTPVDGFASNNVYGSVRILAKPYDKSSTKQEDMLYLAYGGSDGSPNGGHPISIYECNEKFECYGEFLYHCVNKNINKKTDECYGWKDNGKYWFKGKIMQDPNPYLREDKRFVFVHSEYKELINPVNIPDLERKQLEPGQTLSKQGDIIRYVWYAQSFNKDYQFNTSSNVLDFSARGNIAKCNANLTPADPEYATLILEMQQDIEKWINAYPEYNPEWKPTILTINRYLKGIPDNPPNNKNTADIFSNKKYCPGYK